MKRVLGFSFIFMLISCSALKTKENLDYKILYSSPYGGNDKESHAIIDNNNDLINEIESLGLDDSQLEQFTELDFTESVVVILHSGQRNTGGYSISIDKIQKKKELITVFYNEITPNKNENVTMAISNPVLIISIPKADTILLKKK